MSTPASWGPGWTSTRFAVHGPLTVILLLPMLLLAACAPTSAALPRCRASGTSGPATGTWAQANHDYANTRDATDSLISSQSVNQLCLAWTFPVSGLSLNGALATAPIVVDGTVYLQDLKSNVYALDLRSGALKWKHVYNADTFGPDGVAVDQSKVFMASSVQTIAALDAATGTQLWSRQIPSPDTQGIDQQFTAYHGTLYVSTIPKIPSNPSLTSSQYPGGEMGILYALDEQSGSIKWSFNTVQNGDLWGNPQVNSGGGAWYPPALDTSTGTTYWGTSNSDPDPGTAQYPNGSSRPGPNLYTDSELAISSTGQLLWYQQVTPHDLFDYDFQASPILTTATIQETQQPVVIGAGKGGEVVAFEAQSGAVLWKTAVGLHHNDAVQAIPAGQTITVLPGVNGGVDTPMALSGGVVYIPIVDAAAQVSATQFVSDDTATGIGELDALDVNSGEIRWVAHLKSLDVGAATVSGDLVFTATYWGQVLAFNRTSGHQVWSWQAPGGINSPLTVVGDTVLVPVGLGKTPVLVALRIGTAGAG